MLAPGIRDIPAGSRACRNPPRASRRLEAKWPGIACFPLGHGLTALGQNDTVHLLDVYVGIVVAQGASCQPSPAGRLRAVRLHLRLFTLRRTHRDQRQTDMHTHKHRSTEAPRHRDTESQTRTHFLVACGFKLSNVNKDRPCMNETSPPHRNPQACPQMPTDQRHGRESVSTGPSHETYQSFRDTTHTHTQCIPTLEWPREARPHTNVRPAVRR